MKANHSSKKRIRVLFLATDAYGAYGGIAQYNRDCIEALSDMTQVERIDVFQRIGGVVGSTEIQNVQLIATIFNKYLFSLRAFWHAVFNPPDVVFNAHIYHSSLSRMLASVFGATVVSQLHGTEVWEPLPKSILETLRKSALVLCVSRDTKARYLQQLPSGSSDNATIQHNTVSDDFSLGDRKSARKKLGIENEYVLLSVGRLDARKGGYKGHEKVLKTIPEIRRRGIQIKYLIAGVGDDEQRLKNLVDKEGLTDVVEFLGKVPAENLPDLYRASDLFVLPSSGEGFGIVFIEAMACGTPALGLAIGGAPDALVDGELGICVVDEEFPEVLINTIQTLKTDHKALAIKTKQHFGKERFKHSLTQALNIAF